MSENLLNLVKIIRDRKNKDEDKSYTSSLLSGGISKCIDKMEEEFGELKDALNNKSNMAIIRSHVDETRKDHRQILRKLETHDIKLNASGSLNKKPWAIQSDTDKYPLLQAYEHNSQFSNLPHLLKPIILEGDSSFNRQQFYDSMNTAIMTTLSAHSFLLDYEDLYQAFDHT